MGEDQIYGDRITKIKINLHSTCAFTINGLVINIKF